MDEYTKIINKALSHKKLTPIEILIYRDWSENGASELGIQVAKELATLKRESAENLYKKLSKHISCFGLHTHEDKDGNLNLRCFSRGHSGRDVLVWRLRKVGKVGKVRKR